MQGTELGSMATIKLLTGLTLLVVPPGARVPEPMSGTRSAWAVPERATVNAEAAAKEVRTRKPLSARRMRNSRVRPLRETHGRTCRFAPAKDAWIKGLEAGSADPGSNDAMTLAALPTPIQAFSH